MTTTDSMAARTRPPWAWLAMVLGSAVLVLAAAAPAGASFGVASFDGTITNQDGTAATQAGSHPFAMTTTIQFNQTTDVNGNTQPDDNAKDVQVALPPGLVGDPTATPQCTRAEVLDPGSSPFSAGLCPVSTQVGVASVSLANGLTLYLPLYNVVPPPGTPAQFAFVLPGAVIDPPVPVFIDANLRTGGDYGVTARVTNVSQAVPMVGSSLTFWGVPGDAAHDDLRGSCLDIISGGSNGTCPAGGVSVKPLLTLPTSCAGPQSVGLSTDSWQNPGSFASASFVTHDAGLAPVGFDGCDKLDFRPSLSVQPSDATAASPTGLQVDVHMPQDDSPNGLAEAHLKSAAITLPPGVVVSPSSANGLQACSPAEIGIDNAAEPACPAASRIGTVVVDTPLLPDPLKGSVFLAKQNDNPFGSTLAMYLVAEGHGALVKLAGRIDANADTGQLTTTFDNNPQVPFSDLHVELFGGPHAPLSNPNRCGTYTATAVFTAWTGKTVQQSSDYTISGDGHGGPCTPARFRPSLSAGLQNPVAGSSSSFVLRLQRADADNELKTVSTTLPPGLLARIAGVTLCSDAAAASNSCPAASQVGRVEVGAGPGSSPFFINNGKVFFTEGYKGAPYGLAIAVPAVAGPLDLGEVIVRAAVRIDPVTAQVTVDADPMPRILAGIPLQVRDLRVIIDRPGFMRAPTSCGASSIAATVGSYAGDTAALAAPFQVGDCAALPFAPKLAMVLTGRGQTRDGAHPALDATLTQSAGQANLRKMSVTLPLSLALDPDNAQSTALCEFVVGRQTVPNCPAQSIVGTATAVTPLLSVPLTGPVYFVKNVRTSRSGQQIRTLPTLAIVLRGGGITLVVRATTNVVDDRLVTTFDNIPDAPISRFGLHLDGGRHGILVVSNADICKAAQEADQEADAQSGKIADGHVVMATASCGLRVLSRSVGPRAVTVKVGGLGAGRVTVSGSGIRTTRRTIRSASVATVVADLTVRGRHHRPARVRVAFDPAGPARVARVTSSLPRS